MTLMGYRFCRVGSYARLGHAVPWVKGGGLQAAPVDAPVSAGLNTY